MAFLGLSGCIKIFKLINQGNSSKCRPIAVSISILQRNKKNIKILTFSFLTIMYIIRHHIK